MSSTLAGSLSARNRFAAVCKAAPVSAVTTFVLRINAASMRTCDQDGRGRRRSSQHTPAYARVYLPSFVKCCVAPGEPTTERIWRSCVGPPRRAPWCGELLKMVPSRPAAFRQRPVLGRKRAPDYSRQPAAGNESEVYHTRARAQGLKTYTPARPLTSFPPSRPRWRSRRRRALPADGPPSLCRSCRSSAQGSRTG